MFRTMYGARAFIPRFVCSLQHHPRSKIPLPTLCCNSKLLGKFCGGQHFIVRLPDLKSNALPTRLNSHPVEILNFLTTFQRHFYRTAVTHLLPTRLEIGQVIWQMSSFTAGCIICVRMGCDGVNVVSYQLG